VAVALAMAAAGVVVDLDLAGGDAAAVAGAQIAAPDALLSLALAPRVGASDIAAQLAHAGGCPVLPAPALPEQGDLVDEGGVARVLDALGEAGPVVVDGGRRIGVETVPALERAAAIVLVAPPDRRGIDGARRVCGLLGRLGIADRPLGIAAARVPARGASDLAAALGLPVWGRVRELRAVARARQANQAPPAQPFAALAARVLAQLGEAVVG
jgi:MinD-like ATPase involved in chromosome partitioning or flagellar assembly